MIFTGSLFAYTLFSTYLQSSGVAAKDTSRLYSSTSTCPSTTINYITATLTQQCLRTGWVRERNSTGHIEHSPSQATPIDSPIVSNATPDSGSHSSSESALVQQHGNTTVQSASLANATNQEPLTFLSNSSTASPGTTAEPEADPLAENGNFLSFEEWKAQMLEKAGQSPEHVKGTGVGNQQAQARRRSGAINNALDSMGEEGEFEIEFGGFVAPDATASAVSTAEKKDAQSTQDSIREEEKPKKRSKEAGTTSKQRFNYASFDCAATVLKSNSGAKGANSILLENKDNYMLNACSVKNKYLVVELCNDILIDTVVLGNFEFFSSTFQSFRVSVSERYPVKSDKWKEIGTFEARNTRGIQPFLVEDGVIWARYLRIEFLSHYGNEYYCPVSLLRIHGKTMMEDYRADVKAARGEEENDDEDEGEEEPPEKVVAEQLKSAADATTTSLSTPLADDTVTPASRDSEWKDAPLVDKCPRTSLSSPLIQQAELFRSECATTARFCNMGMINVIPWRPVANARTSQTNVPSIIPSQVITIEPVKTEEPKTQGSPTTS